MLMTKNYTPREFCVYHVSLSKFSSNNSLFVIPIAVSNFIYLRIIYFDDLNHWINANNKSSVSNLSIQYVCDDGLREG